MSAAQPIGDYYYDFFSLPGSLRMAPPPSLRSLRYEDTPMYESDDPPALAATLSPPTDRESRAERPTEPPSAAEAEAAFRESQRAPRVQTQPAGEGDLAKLVRTVGAFAIEAREGRAEIMTELRSVSAEVAGIRHEATRTNQRLSGLERAFGLTRDEVEKLKRQLRRALRRIEALEAAQVPSVPVPASPSAT